MRTLNRRHFLRKLAVATGAATMFNPLDLGARSYNKALKKIGVQLFSIPKVAEKDFAGTMQKLASIGFKEIEFYGPYSFSAVAIFFGCKGFAFLNTGLCFCCHIRMKFLRFNV